MAGLKMKRIDSLLKSNIIFGKILSFLEFVLIKSFVDVFLNLNNGVSYNFVILLLVEDTFLDEKLRPKCYKVVFIGQHYLRMPILLVRSVLSVKP